MPSIFPQTLNHQFNKDEELKEEIDHYSSYDEESDSYDSEIEEFDENGDPISGYNQYDSS